MCGSGYPTNPIFYPLPLTFFLHFGQTFHLKKKMETKACILKDIFFDINPIAFRKAKIDLSVCNRVKRKTTVLSKDIKVIVLQYFLICSFFLF